MRHGIELVSNAFPCPTPLNCGLPGGLGLCLALPGLAVDVVSRGIGKGNFLLWLIVGLKKRLLDGLLVAGKASNGLVVGKLGELEQKSIVDSWLRFLIGLWSSKQMSGIDRRR